MKHLTPYGRPGQRFREVDPQEMSSLMRGDAFACLTQAKTATILAALAHAFPDNRFNVIEYRFSCPLSMSTMVGEGGGMDTPRQVRMHSKGYILDTWVHKDGDGDGDANNLLVEFGDRSLPWSPDSLDALPSKDDYFYVKLSYDSDDSDRKQEYLICDGMRGLLDLIESLGRGIYSHE